MPTDDTYGPTPAPGRCGWCSEPAPRHLGWCPRWRWTDSGEGDAPGDDARKFDTGLPTDWNLVDDPPFDPPDADVGPDKPDAQRRRDIYYGTAPGACAHPPAKYSVARGICTACGTAQPPPRCRCVDCLGFTPHPRADLAADAAAWFARYGPRLFDLPGFHRLAYRTVVDLEVAS